MSKAINWSPKARRNQGNAYRLREKGKKWKEIASMLGLCDGDYACTAAAAYADRYNLPWPLSATRPLADAASPAEFNANAPQRRRLDRPQFHTEAFKRYAVRETEGLVLREAGALAGVDSASIHRWRNRYRSEASP